MKVRTQWIAFCLALAVVLTVMGWVTATVLALERERVASERAAVIEEQVRLALWRLDSAATPILSREAAERLGPDDLAEPPPAGVIARFVLDQVGVLQLATTGLEEERRTALEAELGGAGLLQRLDNPGTPVTLELPEPASEGTSLDYFGETQQAYRSANEWNKRAASVQDNLLAYDATIEAQVNRKVDRLTDGKVLARERDSTLQQRIASGSMQPLWLGERLILARIVRDESHARVQGTWLDWEMLRAELLGEIEDLLPHADLSPVVAPKSRDADRLLATLPVRLDPGAFPLSVADPWSPLRVSLVVGWACVLLATGAVLALLRSSLRLSERRGAFVSAVTHELRTPLTTFRMYTEMLSEGMVEHKRTRYLATLRREADRLGELVENVLSYAQIESEGRVAAPQILEIGAFIERVRERLVKRCSAAGMELEIEVPPEVAETTIRIDPTAAEQVLFNLVDNAAKYAPSGDDARIVCSAVLGKREASLIVRDFGPGVPPEDARRIFEPFSKARAHAAGTKPGVGLELALSRRLARQMRGDLVLEAGEPGARFVFRVPLGKL